MKADCGTMLLLVKFLNVNRFAILLTVFGKACFQTVNTDFEQAIQISL